MDEFRTCIYCNRENEPAKMDSEHMIYDYTCTNCGHYKITNEAFQDLPGILENEYKNSKHLASGYLREMSELGLKTETITTENFQTLFVNSKIPKTVMEKIDKLLSYIYRKTDFFGQQVVVNLDETAIGYAINNTEMENMLMTLKDMNYITLAKIVDKKQFPQLTLEGFKKAEQIHVSSVESKQCFIALWFEESVLGIYHKYITKAVTDSGYEPFIISVKEYNNNVCDEIIAEIRKSRFLIADFTGQRGGVYFEAGFAYGLGLPVIWTCREDWFERKEIEVDVKIDGKLKKGMYEMKHLTHFDINHYNFIVWKNGVDLYEKLKNRIMATIPAK